MRLLFLFILSTLSLPLMAQLDLGSHFIRGSWQAHQSNPALLPQQRITISPPRNHKYWAVK